MDGLLERQDALASLAGLAGLAARGDGRVVLLRGEAGVGKTALIARFIAGLNRSSRVLRGWCDALAAPRPLGPLIDMLPSLSAEQAAPLRAAVDAGDSEALYAHLVDMFGNGDRWVCVIEDVHWADGATLDLLRFLARRIDALPVLLVVSYRDDEIGDQHPLAVLLGDLATYPALTRIALAALSPAAVSQLAAGSGVNSDALYRLTGGNPFYVTEVLAAGSDVVSRDALPRSVSEAVWGRLARLSVAGRETAQASAVCGPRAPLELVQAVCPGAGQALAECLRAGVLVADADTVGFRHELARRAALDQIPAYERRLLHKRALTVLAESIDPNALAALAFHAEQAGDVDAVQRYAPAAAERASALGAHREAAALYASTLRHAATITDEQKVVWLEQHALSSYLSGLIDASARSFREAVESRRRLGDRLGEGDNLRWLSHMLWPLGRTTEAAEAGLGSLQLLEEFGPCSQLAWSLVNLAELAAFSYDPRCDDFAARAIALGTDLGDVAVVVRARCYAALATVAHTDTGWDELEAAWRDAMATEGLTEHAGMNGAVVCWFAALHHQLHRAEGYIGETLAFCAAHDLGMFHALAAGSAALVALHRGDWVSALSCADDVLTRPALTPFNKIMPLITVALIRARRAEGSVGGLLDEALAAAEPDDLFRLGAVWAARAEAAWLAGDDDTARAEAQAGLAAATENADPWLVGHLHRWLHLTGAPLDDRPVIDTVTPYRLEISGQWQAAVDEWTRRDCPYDAAIAQLGGDIDAVQAALATFRKLGARPAARRAHQRLAQLRGRTPYTRRADTLADPDGLTRREREVLALIADGRTDGQIAAALHISPKTAGSHVGSILTKLGVDNRAQAAARAVQRQSTPSA